MQNYFKKKYSGCQFFFFPLSALYSIHLFSYSGRDAIIKQAKMCNDPLGIVSNDKVVLHCCTTIVQTSFKLFYEFKKSFFFIQFYTGKNLVNGVFKTFSYFQKKKKRYFVLHMPNFKWYVTKNTN